MTIKYFFSIAVGFAFLLSTAVHADHRRKIEPELPVSAKVLKVTTMPTQKCNMFTYKVVSQSPTIESELVNSMFDIYNTQSPSGVCSETSIQEPPTIFKFDNVRDLTKAEKPLTTLETKRLSKEVAPKDFNDKHKACLASPILEIQLALKEEGLSNWDVEAVKIEMVDNSEYKGYDDAFSTDVTNPFMSTFAKFNEKTGKIVVEMNAYLNSKGECITSHLSVLPYQLQQLKKDPKFKPSKQSQASDATVDEGADVKRADAPKGSKAVKKKPSAVIR